MENVVASVRNAGVVPAFSAELKAINCHHNYVARERHYGQNILVTRKGAVRAAEGDMGIIPGSMERAPILSAARAIARASTVAVTAQGAPCRATKRSAASRSKITPA